jgi:plastocyanin
MRKLGIAKRVGAVLLSLLAVWSMVAAASGTVISSVSAQSTSSRPSTWHVLVGGQSQDQELQAEGYYPRVITIDAGDTVVWTLNTGEIHSVTFLSQPQLRGDLHENGHLLVGGCWRRFAGDAGKRQRDADPLRHA